ncbi:electron transfer flavoprotein beta subunit lysine methyltransferase-like [Asterias amurensis]|uniref:electron transfer flavoprotein beta subunit lysine methyltransferase-like n=1 Tax=Asterias amurensis TaxID=7602 RepID=UPI003AB66DDA
MTHHSHRYTSLMGKLLLYFRGKTNGVRCLHSSCSRHGRRKNMAVAPQNNNLVEDVYHGFHANQMSFVSALTSVKFRLNSQQPVFKAGCLHNHKRNGKSFAQIHYEKCSSDWSNINMMRRGMSTSSGSAEQFILDNSEISRDHLTPEIALHLMSPSSSGLWDASIEESSAVLMENGISDPFWAFYWPGGQTLTRYLLDHPAVVQGKRILDVGSGCGASAIASAKCGAKSVLANDIDPVAVQAIQLNATLNNVTIATTTSNLIGSLDNQWDVVFLGDMFYDREFTNIVVDWLKYLAANGADVLIGDPGRLYLQEHPITRLLTNVYKVDLSDSCKMENSGMTQGFVWKLCNSRVR